MKFLVFCVIFYSGFKIIKSEEVKHVCSIFDGHLHPNIFKHLSRTITPSLDGKTKGEAGKIAVIGGSVEYSGAPYFSAITALKSGADLVYVITTKEASPIIKGYSPDLIVYPYLESKYASKILSLLPKMDVIVIGPGLGTDNEIMSLIYNIIQDCKRLGKPLVIDADGLYAISKNISVLKNYPCPGVVLTPNQREANRLLEAVSTKDTNSNWYNYWGDCVSVLVKGEKDMFYSNNTTYTWTATGGGSGRRAAGQGDILSGSLGTFYNWALHANLCESHNNTQLAQSVAAYAAAKMTRMCNSIAFTLHGRSMIATDMIQQIHPAFDAIFSEDPKTTNL